jgi:hypothetical protein
MMRRLFVLAGACGPLLTGAALADQLVPSHVSSAVHANEGQPARTVFVPELRQVPVAYGAMRLENPSDQFATYGYAEDHLDKSAQTKSLMIRAFTMHTWLSIPI